MILLAFSDRVRDLEKENKYNEAIDYLIELWQMDCNINNLLCLATQLWYTLVYWEEYYDAHMTREGLSDLYTHLLNYGFVKFKADIRFLLITGYMLNVIPYWYSDMNGDLNGWQKRGMQMIRKAYLEDENNKIAKLLICKRYSEMRKIKAEITPVFDQYFTGSTNVVKYFRGICCI